MSTSGEEKASAKSDWSVIGLAHKLLLAWEKAGGTKADINRLAENLALLRQIVWMLRGSWELKPKQFPTWYVAKLGRYKAVEGFYQAIRETRPQARDTDLAYFGPYAAYVKSMLEKVDWWQTEVTEELVLVLDTDLGLTEEYGYRHLLAVAETVGLYECQQESPAVLVEHFEGIGSTIPWDFVRRPRFHRETGRSPEVHVAMRPINEYGDSILTLTTYGSLAKRVTDSFYPGSHWILSRRKPVATQD